MSNTSESPQRKLFDEFYEGLKNLNLDILAKHLHKDFRRFIYPRSLNKPEHNREEWLVQFEKVAQNITGFQTTTHSIIEAPGKFVVHVTSEAVTSLGVKTHREAIYIIHIVDEDGTLKIIQIDGFIDSKADLDIAEAMAAAKAEAAAK